MLTYLSLCKAHCMFLGAISSILLSCNWRFPPQSGLESSLSLIGLIIKVLPLHLADSEPIFLVSMVSDGHEIFTKGIKGIPYASFSNGPSKRYRSFS
jgi:hypothetical protein